MASDSDLSNDELPGNDHSTTHHVSSMDVTDQEDARLVTPSVETPVRPLPEDELASPMESSPPPLTLPAPLAQEEAPDTSELFALWAAQPSIPPVSVDLIPEELMEPVLEPALPLLSPTIPNTPITGWVEPQQRDLPLSIPTSPEAPLVLPPDTDEEQALPLLSPTLPISPPAPGDGGFDARRRRLRQGVDRRQHETSPQSPRINAMHRRALSFGTPEIEQGKEDVKRKLDEAAMTSGVGLGITERRIVPRSTRAETLPSLSAAPAVPYMIGRGTPPSPLRSAAT